MMHGSHRPADYALLSLLATLWGALYTFIKVGRGVDPAGDPDRGTHGDYNAQRPHGAIGHLTPSEYANSGRKRDFEVAELQLRTVR